MNGEAIDGGGNAGITSRGAGIARGGNPGGALQIRLLGLLLVAQCGCEGGRRDLRLAIAVAIADHLSEIVVYGVRHGVPRILSDHINDGCTWRDGAGPVQIEVGLVQFTLNCTRIVANNEGRRIVRRQAEVLPKVSYVSRIDVGLAHDDDGLPRPIKPVVIEGSDVVNGGQIARSEIVGTVGPIRPRRGAAFLAVRRLRAKVVQATDCEYDRLQSRRNGRLGRVGKVQLALDLVTVNRGMKPVLHLPGIAAEPDPLARPRHLLDFEFLRLQPGNDPGDVARAETEPISVLFRREPLVIVRRCRIALLAEKLFDGRLLGWSGPEYHCYGWELQQRICRAQIRTRLGPGVQIALQDDRLLRVDPTGNAVGLCEQG